jgi:hypothetical protein
MTTDGIEDKQQLHTMVDLLAPEQVHALRGLVEVTLDPLSRKLAMAPIEDEEISEEEERSVAEAREWLKHNKPISHEEVLSQFGLSMDDFCKMSEYRCRRNRAAVAKRIAWTDQAKSDIRGIDRQTALNLLHGLARFALIEEGDVKQLQGIEPPEFRLRLGDYRVRFRDLGGSIEILHVRHPS